MSRIADQIRAYVNDHDVSNHYGEWGILRRDQRRLIRRLCDTCDAFERAADELSRKQFNSSEWISVEERLPDEQGHFLTVDETGYMMVCMWTKQFGWFSHICKANKITHWMPLPEPPKMKGGAGR